MVISRFPYVALLAFAALALMPLGAFLSGDGFLLSIGTRVMIFAIAAISLDLILGYGAMVSFGHAAFIGIGAYAAGILSSHGITDFTLHILVGLAGAAVFALATGAISLRTKGVYFIMITLAFGQMIYFLAVSLAAYGGDDGLTLPGRSTVFGTAILKNPQVFYYVVLGLLIGVYLVCRAIVGSRFGRVLQGTKQNAVRMQAIGFEPFRYQIVAYCIAGMLGSIAGVLLANQAEFVSPAYMSWQRSGELIVMVVLGGLGTLTGPLIGAFAYLVMEEVLSHFTEHWKIIFGPFLILVVLFARGGIAGFLKGRGL